MIKLAVAALWISIATTGALLVAFQTSLEQDEAAKGGEPTPFSGLDYVKTGIISVPVFDKGRVHGYFLARLVFVAEGKRLAALKLPAEALLSDQIYSHLHANPEIDFTRREALDVEAFRQNLRAGVNQRLGEELIREILIEQIDYLPKDDAGSGAVRPANSAAGH